MNAQFPIPSFDDFRKLFEFWFDQQNKWFYFETESLQTGITAKTDHSPKNVVYAFNNTRETYYYNQNRIVGKIHDVVSFPPSLLLQDVSVFTVELNFEYQVESLLNKENREKYGLVFSQITYYEPIEDIELFLKNDKRVKKK
ncbi:MAG: hypothetical protein L6Q49_02460 [Anaerolineales bacterium]|nr:hypothetical protein [Anaerolineales bacterium]